MEIPLGIATGQYLLDNSSEFMTDQDGKICIVVEGNGASTYYVLTPNIYPETLLGLSYLF